MRFLQSIVRYAAVLPSCKQFIECRVRSTAIKHTSGHVAFWPQPVGSLPLAQNAWHCTSTTLSERGGGGGGGRGKRERSLFGRAGASPPSRATSAGSIYISQGTVVGIA